MPALPKPDLRKAAPITCIKSPRTCICIELGEGEAPCSLPVLAERVEPLGHAAVDVVPVAELPARAAAPRVHVPGLRYARSVPPAARHRHHALQREKEKLERSLP